MTIENWIGAIGLLVTFSVIVFRAGRWSGRSDSLGSLFKRETKNGHADSVIELLARVAAIEAQMVELNTAIRVTTAERSLLIEQNRREHDDFRALMAATQRRIEANEVRLNHLEARGD